jgi:Tol biopolymer transport system component
MVVFAAATGLRPSELFALEQGDVDRDAGGRNRAFIAGSEPAWSRDGERVAFAHWDGSRYQLELKGSDGRQPRLLGPGHRPVWSPDGRWLASIRHCGSGNRDDCVWLSRPDGRRARQLARLETTNWLVWSSDSRRLIAVGGSVSIIPLHGRLHRLALG